MKQEVADSLKRRAQGTASQTSKQEGTSPTIKISSAVSKTKTLGDPIDLGGTIENTNPFAISHVEVQFLHVCTGETRTVTLFVNDKVPPRSVKEWQVAVTFREGHFPDALINILLGWKKAP
jgi:chorismate synthase